MCSSDLVIVCGCKPVPTTTGSKVIFHHTECFIRERKCKCFQFEVPEHIAALVDSKGIMERMSEHLVEQLLTACRPDPIEKTVYRIAFILAQQVQVVQCLFICDKANINENYSCADIDRSYTNEKYECCGL